MPTPDHSAPSGTPHFSAVLPTPFGALGVIADNRYVHEIIFLPDSAAAQPPSSIVAEMAIRQLSGYLADPTYRFNLPLAPRGSPFRRRTWAAISDISSGKTITYLQLADSVGSVARAVGQACGDNPFPLVIPCHRVVSARGLGGFAHRADGLLVDTKRWLLRHEGAI